MYKAFTVFFLFLAVSYQLDAQIHPEEASILNYRIIGFSFPSTRSVNKYKIEIAAGTYYSEDSFKKNIIASFSADTNKMIGEVPAFGKQYTWRYIIMDVVHKKSGLYHFSTAIGPEVDTNIIRLRIMKHPEKYKDAYIFSDATRTLYDMNGVPVWFLPESQEMPVSNKMIYGDFKITDKGTITFLRDGDDYEQAYEVNYNGNILWESPKTAKVNRDSVEYKPQLFIPLSNGLFMCNCYTSINCHHEFTRLATGHYMFLDNAFMWLKLPGRPDINQYAGGNTKKKNIKQDSNNVHYEQVGLGTLIEYDKEKNIVWSWNSSEYFIGSDVYDHVNKEGVYDPDDVHANAFYFDEKDSTIYISFRHISRIIKIKYPSGNVLKVYGKLNEPDAPGYNNPLFHHQHNCGITKEGYLSVFNNNDRYKGALPTLLLMQEPVSEQDTLKKVWEYECTTEGMEITGTRPNFGGRGSAIELPDLSILACMASEKYTKIFIVGRDKKILWSALPERWNPDEQKWKAIFQYRASMVLNKKELERLIWNGAN